MANSDKSIRLAQAVPWLAVLVIVACLAIIARWLPIGAGLDLLHRRIAEGGVLGMVAFGTLYVVTTVLLFPGAALGVLAGAVFGVWRGILIVSLASTVAAALAFLLGRYAFRGAIERRLSTQPRFAAIDRAVAARGWVIVALLRLSPIVPFNLSNYFFGLTGIGFWPYVLASWLCMLPGTALYIYLGYTAGAAAGAGKVSGAWPWHWTLLLGGLALVIVATLFITRLARRALAACESTVAETKAVGPTTPAPVMVWSRRTAVLMILALLMLALTAWIWLNRGALAGRFGPRPEKVVHRFNAKPAARLRYGR